MKKTIENSSFRGEQKVIITGEEFLILQQAIDDTFKAMDGMVIPKIFLWMDKEGNPVENPTEEQIKEQELTQVLDVKRTFERDNGFQGYSGKITFFMVEAKRRLMEIHMREAEAGRTALIDDILQEFKDKQEFNLKTAEENAG